MDEVTSARGLCHGNWGLAILVLLMSNTLMASDCSVRVAGGAGTVADPLRVEVQGQVGLMGMIDDALPVQLVPAIETNYADMTWAGPNIPPFLATRPWLAWMTLSLIIGVCWGVGVWLVLWVFGRRLAIRQRQDVRE